MSLKPCCAVCREPRPLLASICVDCFVETTKRDPQSDLVRFRCTRAFKDLIEYAAKDAGKDASKYLRDLVLKDVAS